MNFTSPELFFLLLFTSVIYYIPGLSRIQVGVLIASSFYFYAFSQPYLLILLIVSSAINAICSYRILTGTDRMTNIRITALGVATNLMILILFKYKGFLAQEFFTDSLRQGRAMDLVLAIPLPLGISFYTFQGISLLVDTLRDTDRKDQNPPVYFWPHVLKTFLYIAFFARIVAGPIVKSKDFLPQIRTKRLVEVKWQGVFDALLLGYFLKTAIADNLHNLTYSLHYPEILNIAGLNLLALALAYSMQIFSDFAGYSLIAIGIGRLFGYELPMNFRYPYIAASLSDFWQRWHMTLSNWLKEYLYIPLGGNRKGTFRCYANLIIVMALGGLWHGAGWNYVIWGMYHGLLLCLERFLARRLPGSRPDRSLFSGIKIPVVFFLVSAGWLFFIFNDISHVSAFFSAVYNNFQKRPDYGVILTILLYSLPVLVMHFYHFMERRPPWRHEIKPLVQAIMLCALVLNSGSSQPFIYFQF
jgi:alginate O-acetyltransferase complex protein AlgI